MRTKAWLAVALVVGGVAYGRCFTRPGGAAPDEKLASELGEICDIARKNVDTPERGVRGLGRYLATHNLVGDLGSMITMIERIDDDRAHDARARLARQRLVAPLRACEQDWMEFAEAVEDDPEARALVDRFGARLNRTLEILFGGDPLDLRRLPARLERLLPTAASDRVTGTD